MTALHNHIIQKQTIEITFPSGKNAIALQDKIKSIYYEKVVPLLDDLFSGFIKDDTVIRLDKLDIDVGTVNENDLEKQLVEKIIIAVKQQLESSLQFDVKDSSNVQLLSGAQSVADAFLYFLKQGYFPWWSNINDLSVLESAITKQYKAGKDLPAKLLQLINADSNVTARLNFQFSKSFRTFIVEKIFASNDIKQQRFLSELFLQADEFNTIKNIVKDNVDEIETAGKNLHDNDEIINKQAEKNIKKGKRNKEEKKFDVNDESSSQSLNIKRHKQEHDSNTPIQFKDDTARSEQSLSNKKNNQVFDDESKQDEIKNTTSFDKENNINQTGDLLKDENAGTAANKKETIANEADTPVNQSHVKEKNLNADKIYQQQIKKEFDKETIYLDLAGLVILHPFIIEFFAAIKLTENNQFISEALMHKAVLLLGFIATGKTEIEEQLLILPKLLCGMELTEPIEKEIIISDEEKHEVTELLNTVITYWQAIRNTSPDGLRGSFLLRAGKLSPREGGWQLDVEQKTWDILLGKLPWGISIIKLPWMQEILFVNWQ